MAFTLSEMNFTRYSWEGKAQGKRVKHGDNDLLTCSPLIPYDPPLLTFCCLSVEYPVCPSVKQNVSARKRRLEQIKKYFSKLIDKDLWSCDLHRKKKNDFSIQIAYGFVVHNFHRHVLLCQRRILFGNIHDKRSLCLKRENRTKFGKILGDVTCCRNMAY